MKRAAGFADSRPPKNGQPPPCPKHDSNGANRHSNLEFANFGMAYPLGFCAPGCEAEALPGYHMGNRWQEKTRLVRIVRIGKSCGARSYGGNSDGSNSSILYSMESLSMSCRVSGTFPLSNRFSKSLYTSFGLPVLRICFSSFIHMKKISLVSVKNLKKNLYLSGMSRLIRLHALCFVPKVSPSQ